MGRKVALILINGVSSPMETWGESQRLMVGVVIYQSLMSLNHLSIK